ncbi:MAG: UDP binding domain-containing protein, partial [Paludibacteraceae bacterium]
EFGANVDVCDPWANVDEVKEEYEITVLTQVNKNKKYSAIVLAVAHDEFKDFNFERYYTEGAVVFDAKAVVDRRWVDARL